MTLSAAIEEAPEFFPTWPAVTPGDRWFLFIGCFPSASFCLSGHFLWALSVILALAWFLVGLAGIFTHLSVLVFLFSFITISW